METINYFNLKLGFSEGRFNIKDIEIDKKKIEHALKSNIHPDHLLASDMRRKYRELEEKARLCRKKSD